MLGDPGTRSSLRLEPALGYQLSVRISDRVPCDTEIASEVTRGRQPDASGEPPAAHGVSESGLKCCPDPRAGQFQVQIDPVIGPRFCHRYGPYSWAVLHLT